MAEINIMVFRGSQGPRKDEPITLTELYYGEDYVIHEMVGCKTERFKSRVSLGAAATQPVARGDHKHSVR